MLKSIYGLLVAGILTLILGAIVVVFGSYELVTRDYFVKRGGWGPVGTWIRMTWCRMVFRFLGIRVRLSGPGAATMRSRKGCVFVANHQSLFDIPALMQCLPKGASFLAKIELLRVPFFGWGAYIAGTIFIDRKRGSENASLSKLEKYLRSGISLVFFPEGTRSSDGSVGPFKRGAFAYAIAAEAPIIPISILGSGRLLPKRSLLYQKGVIDIYVHDPVSTKGLHHDDRLELAERVRRIVASAGLPLRSTD